MLQAPYFEVVYDARLEERVSYGPALVAGVLCVALGLAFALAPHIFPRDRIQLLPPRILGGAVMVVSLLSTCGSWVEMDRDAEFRRRLEAGEYVLVEGVVSRLVPGDPGGHREEVWTVEGRGGTRRYRFNRAVVEPGYHQFRGPVRRGHYVRIADVDGRIGRLEIAR